MLGIVRLGLAIRKHGKFAEAPNLLLGVTFAFVDLAQASKASHFCGVDSVFVEHEQGQAEALLGALRVALRAVLRKVVVDLAVCACLDPVGVVDRQNNLLHRVGGFACSQDRVPASQNTHLSGKREHCVHLTSLAGTGGSNPACMASSIRASLWRRSSPYGQNKAIGKIVAIFALPGVLPEVLDHRFM
jgi:hypothetical protein